MSLVLNISLAIMAVVSMIILIISTLFPLRSLGDRICAYTFFVFAFLGWIITIVRGVLDILGSPL